MEQKNQTFQGVNKFPTQTESNGEYHQWCKPSTKATLKNLKNYTRELISSYKDSPL